MSYFSKILFKKKRHFVKVLFVLRSVLNIISTIIITGFCIFFLYLGVKIFLFDQFPVPSSSMEPTIMPGDHILMNKTVFGARLYKQLTFKKNEIPYMYRIKGLRKIQYNDILVFNDPYPLGMLKEISFSLKKVYVKRCVGLPGDTLRIVNGIINSSGCNDTIGYYPNEERLHKQRLEGGIECSLRRGENIPRWTVLELGPLFIPSKGSVVLLDSTNYLLYEKIIKYETDKNFFYKDGKVLLDGKEIHSYRFTQNYYFMCGDNCSNSRDSRYWGLLPEKFIMGVVNRILYSIDRSTNKFRFERFFKKMK